MDDQFTIYMYAFLCHLNSIPSDIVDTHFIPTNIQSPQY